LLAFLCLSLCQFRAHTHTESEDRIFLAKRSADGGGEGVVGIITEIFWHPLGPTPQPTSHLLPLVLVHWPYRAVSTWPGTEAGSKLQTRQINNFSIFMPSQQKAHTHVKKKKFFTYVFYLFSKSIYRNNSYLSTSFIITTLKFILVYKTIFLNFLNILQVFDNFKLEFHIC